MFSKLNMFKINNLYLVLWDCGNHYKITLTSRGDQLGDEISSIVDGCQNAKQLFNAILANFPSYDEAYPKIAAKRSTETIELSKSKRVQSIVSHINLLLKDNS